MFLDFLLFRDHNDNQISLTDFVSALQLRFGKTVKKQSIDERFNSYAVDFIKQLVEDQLKNQITIPVAGQSYFKRIKIKDSTRFQIPESLKEHYPGPDGGATGAGVHVQFEYDFLSGKISDLNVTNAKRQDNTDARETIEQVKKGDLIIRDLGYFVQSVFKDIIEKEAYFISRLKPKSTLYSPEGKIISLDALRLDMEKKGIRQTEILVTTNQISTPIRLVIERLPEQVVNTRLARAHHEARKKGRQLTDQYKEYASLGLFITNVPAEVLSAQSVVALYHVRWQIELRFKAWKSYCQLSKVKKMKRYRFECQLYANLLYILLNWEVAYNFQHISYNSLGRQISINKFYKTVVQFIYEFRQSLMESREKLSVFIKLLYSLSRSNLMQENRKCKINLTEIRGYIIVNQHIK